MNLRSVTDVGHTVASGLEHGDYLIELAAAVLHGTVEQATRDEGLQRLGNDGLVDAIAVASGFNAINMVADATGVPLDAQMDQRSADFRADIGIEAFYLNA
ncbi:MAG: hypothetical protein O7H39_05925 [Gammaproteobacteria bacterium]|nr:hypothetical protein [Gammaproteobacteria bacterium]